MSIGVAIIGGGKQAIHRHLVPVRTRLTHWVFHFLAGIFAKEEHLPAVLAASNLSLKAIYSRSLNSVATLTEGLAQKVEFYSDETKDQSRGYEDLLKNEEIQAVIIA